MSGRNYRDWISLLVLLAFNCTSFQCVEPVSPIEVSSATINFIRKTVSSIPFLDKRIQRMVRTTSSSNVFYSIPKNWLCLLRLRGILNEQSTIYTQYFRQLNLILAKLKLRFPLVDLTTAENILHILPFYAGFPVYGGYTAILRQIIDLDPNLESSKLHLEAEHNDKTICFVPYTKFQQSFIIPRFQNQIKTFEWFRGSKITQVPLDTTMLDRVLSKYNLIECDLSEFEYHGPSNVITPEWDNLDFTIKAYEIQPNADANTQFEAYSVKKRTMRLRINIDRSNSKQHILNIQEYLVDSGDLQVQNVRDIIICFLYTTRANPLSVHPYRGLIAKNFIEPKTIPPYYGVTNIPRLLPYYVAYLSEGLVKYESISTNPFSSSSNDPQREMEIIKELSFPFGPDFQTYFKLLVNIGVKNLQNPKYSAFLSPIAIFKPLIKLNESHPVLRKLSRLNPTNLQYPTTTQPITDEESAKQQVLKTIMVSLPGYTSHKSISSCLSTLFNKQLDRDSAVVLAKIQELESSLCDPDVVPVVNRANVDLNLMDPDYKTVGIVNNPIYSWFELLQKEDNVRGGTRPYKFVKGGKTVARLTHLLSDEMWPDTDAPIQAYSLKGTSPQEETVLLLYNMKHDQKMHTFGMVYQLPSQFNITNLRQIEPSTGFETQPGIFGVRLKPIRSDNLVEQISKAYTSARTRLSNQMQTFFAGTPPSSTVDAAKRALLLNTPLFGYSIKRDEQENVEKVYVMNYPLSLTVRLPFYDETTEPDFKTQLQKNLQVYLKKWVIKMVQSLNSVEDTTKDLLQKMKIDLPKYRVLTQTMEQNNTNALQKLKTISETLPKHLEQILHYDISTKENLPFKLRKKVQTFPIKFDKIYQEIGFKDTAAANQLQNIKDAQYKKTVPATWDYPKWFYYRNKFELVLLDLFLKTGWKEYKKLSPSLNLDKNVLELMLQIEKQGEPSLATLQLASRVAPFDTTDLLHTTSIPERLRIGTQLKQKLNITYNSYGKALYPVEQVHEQMSQTKNEAIQELDKELTSSATYYQKANVATLIQKVGLEMDPCLTNRTITYNFLKQFKSRMDAVYKQTTVPFYTKHGKKFGFSVKIGILDGMLKQLIRLEMNIKLSMRAYNRHESHQIDPSFRDKVLELNEKKRQLFTNVEAMDELLEQGQKLNAMVSITQPLKKTLYFYTDLDKEPAIKHKLIDILRRLKDAKNPLKEKLVKDLNLQQRLDQIRTLEQNLEDEVQTNVRALQELQQQKNAVQRDYLSLYKLCKQLKEIIQTIDTLLDEELDTNASMYGGLKAIRTPYPTLPQYTDIETTIENYKSIMKPIREAMISRLYIMQSYPRMSQLLRLSQGIWSTPYPVDKLRGELTLSDSVKTFIKQFNDSIRQLSQQYEWNLPSIEHICTPHSNVEYPTVKQSIRVPVYHFKLADLKPIEAPLNVIFTNYSATFLQAERSHVGKYVLNELMGKWSTLVCNYNQYIAPSFNAQVLLNYLKQVYEDKQPSTREIGLVYRSLKNIVYIHPENTLGVDIGLEDIREVAQCVGNLDLGAIPKSSTHPFDTDLTFKNIYKDETQPVVINAQLLPYGPAYIDSGTLSSDPKTVLDHGLIGRGWSLIMKTIGIQGFKVEANYGIRFQTPLTQIYPKLVDELESKVNELDEKAIKAYIDDLNAGVKPVQEMYEAFFDYLSKKANIKDPKKQALILKHVGLYTEATKLGQQEFEVENQLETTDRFNMDSINMDSHQTRPSPTYYANAIASMKPFPQAKSFEKTPIPDISKFDSELKRMNHAVRRVQEVIEHVELFQRQSCIHPLQKKILLRDYKDCIHQKLREHYYNLVATRVGTIWDHCLKEAVLEPAKDEVRLRVNSLEELAEFERAFNRNWDVGGPLYDHYLDLQLHFYKFFLVNCVSVDKLRSFTETVPTSNLPKTVQLCLQDCLNDVLQEFKVQPDTELSDATLKHFFTIYQIDQIKSTANHSAVALMKDLKKLQSQVVREAQRTHKITLIRTLNSIINGLDSV